MSSSDTNELADEVEEHRAALEEWAASDWPLADDVAALLAEIDKVR